MNAPRPSARDTVGARLRTHRPLIVLELALVALALALRAAGVIRNPSLVILLAGWLSLWLRREGWRGVGLKLPARWWRTLLAAAGLGVAYDLADIFAFLPLLRRLTGQSVRVEQLGDLRGNLGAVLLLLALTWIFAAFAEELAWRGYLLHRIADLLGRGKAAFIASALVVGVLFGLAHGAQGLAGVLDNIVAGLFFGVLYLAAGRNLWLPILVHGIVNTTSLLFLYLGTD